MKQKPILSHHQNYVTQCQYTRLRKALEVMDGNPDGLPERVYQAQVTAIRRVMDEMRQAMEDYTRQLLEAGEIW